MADWVMPYRGITDIQRGTKAKCRIRIYEDPEYAEHIIVLSEVGDNHGESIASAAEVVVGTLMDALSKSLDLSVYRAPVFICHYPPQITHITDAYELVTFKELAVSEKVVDTDCSTREATGDDARVAVQTVGEAKFYPLDPEMVRLVLA